MNVFTPRQKLIASKVNTNFANIASGTDMDYNAAWTSYNVGWYSSGGKPSLGNGTLAGKYIRLGRLVIVRVFLKGGSSTTYGSGAWEFTLPPLLPKSIDDYDDADTSSFTGTNMGVGYYEDLATLGYFGTVDLMSTKGNIFRLLVSRADGTYGVENWVTNTAPFTWASGDFFSVLFTYETEASVV